MPRFESLWHCSRLFRSDTSKSPTLGLMDWPEQVMSVR